MGGSPSKQNSPEPKVTQDSTITTSSGFHLLEFHGGTVGNLGLIVLAAASAFLGLHYMLKWRQKRAARRLTSAQGHGRNHHLPNTVEEGASRQLQSIPHRETGAAASHGRFQTSSTPSGTRISAEGDVLSLLLPVLIGHQKEIDRLANLEGQMTSRITELRHQQSLPGLFSSPTVTGTSQRVTGTRTSEDTRRRGRQPSRTPTGQHQRSSTSPEMSPIISRKFCSSRNDLTPQDQSQSQNLPSSRIWET